MRVVLGLDECELTDEGLKNLTEKEWMLTPVADRMGLRFDGPGWNGRQRRSPSGQDPSSLTDAGYPVGSIQIPAAPSQLCCTTTRYLQAAMPKPAP